MTEQTISKLSNGTNTYVLKDAKAREDISNLATVATTGAYSDLSGTPTIPTVNNATLTIQKNGTAVNTFTANASSDVTVNITVPTNTNELTNGAGFITGISSSDVTTALGYTPYSSENPSGYQANVIETVKVNGTAQTVTSKAVDISVPTTTSSVTSGSSAALTSGGAYTALQSYQTTSNLVTSVSSSSTDSQYPSAKLFYDTVGDIESVLNTINSGGVTMVNLNVTLPYDSNSSHLTSFNIHNQTYYYSDFSFSSLNVRYELIIQIPAGTDLPWNATVDSSYEITPSSGTLNLDQDGTLSLSILPGK